MIRGRARQSPEGRWIRRLDFKRTAFYSRRTKSTRKIIRGKNDVGRIVEKWKNVVRDGIVSRGLEPFRLAFASAYEGNNNFILISLQLFSSLFLILQKSTRR
jgi:hypothetical protein